MYLHLPGGEYVDLHHNVDTSKLSPAVLVQLYEFWDSLLVECENLVLTTSALQYAVEEKRRDEEKATKSSSVDSPSDEPIETVNSEVSQEIENSAPEEDNVFEAYDTQLVFKQGEFWCDLLELSRQVLRMQTLELEDQSTAVGREAEAWRPESLQRFQVVFHYCEFIAGPVHSREFYAWIGSGVGTNQKDHKQRPLNKFSVSTSVEKHYQYHEMVERILCASLPLNAELLRKCGETVREISQKTPWKVQPVEGTDEVLKPKDPAWGVPEGVGKVAVAGHLPKISNCPDVELKDRVLLHAVHQNLKRRLVDSQLVEEYVDIFQVLKELRPTASKKETGKPKPVSGEGDPFARYRHAIWQLTQETPQLTPKKAWGLFGNALQKIGIKDAGSYEEICKNAKDLHERTLKRRSKNS